MENETREKCEMWLAMNVAGYTQEQVDLLVIFRKEAARDTRHACAEAVVGLPECCEQPNGNSAIDPDDAHNACMNVKAV